MSTLSQFMGGGGGIKPNGLINGASSYSTLNAGAGAVGLSRSSIAGAIKSVTPGAQTANVLATAFSATGRGCLHYLAVSSNDTTSRTHRLKVTIDDVVIFDATTSAVTQTDAINTAIGVTAIPTTATPTPIFDPLLFDQSLLIEYATSVTETGKATIGFRYTPRA